MNVMQNKVTRFTLKDINTFHYNCGHYPEYEVQCSPTGEYESLEAAEKAAKEKNEKSRQAWRRFLNS